MTPTPPHRTQSEICICILCQVSIVNCKQLFLVFPDRVYNEQQNVLICLQKQIYIVEMKNLLIAYY